MRQSYVITEGTAITESFYINNIAMKCIYESKKY